MERLEPTQEMASGFGEDEEQQGRQGGQLQFVAPLVLEKSSSNTWGWRRRCSCPAHVHVSSVSAAEQITVDAVVFHWIANKGAAGRRRARDGAAGCVEIGRAHV